MTDFDLVLRARRVITGAGEQARWVGVRNERIAAIEPFDTPVRAAQVIDLADDEVLLPGLVDTHVHVNEPGRTEWEGFASATRAAAAGGVTTIVDMPLNSVPPTVDVDALRVKRKAAQGQVWVDTGFWGGAVPGNVSALRPLHDAGVFGFKCFLLHSGVDEFPHLTAAELDEAMRAVAAFDGLLIVHAEDADTIDHAPHEPGAAYADFLRSRPRVAEDVAIAQVIELAKSTGCRAHILHLSSADALPMIAAARGEGVRLTVETCPHYLSFTAEEIGDGATQFKCCPPIREADNREQLWQALAEGVIDCVVSDHSPCTPELKRLDLGDFAVAWGGISSIQLGLPAVWSGARERGHTLANVVEWMAERPATVAGLANKGRVAVGADADFCVFAPDAEFVVDPAALHHKNPITPYAGRALTGVVRETWLRGTRVAERPHGQLISRGES
ncbi:allantoinase [Actinokineospora alba]|uniref:allantoinase n=1 Tax=Actinokineospora alba TaxID=504798 RepID=A0A1H0G132_9PSEU|nr:allantoinase AllB [Actinokineospora alba]TDP69713.1 allantoinase [Actinokineospora alba]SDI10442.1 allantoinase [Actinokineospora alba]SDO00570.1 allantoinase [Actinokineospora alba]